MLICKSIAGESKVSSTGQCSLLRPLNKGWGFGRSLRLLGRESRTLGLQRWWDVKRCKETLGRGGAVKTVGPGSVGQHAGG